jgi:S-adenosylmethionine synthetase
VTNSFTSTERWLFTSESVTEGHPDKLCDQISDAMLDECLKQDPNSRVACETATTTGTIIVCGEITTKAWVDVPAMVRGVVRDIGYTDAEYGFDYQSCGVLTAIKEQSREIAMGVDESLEARAGKDPHELGAGDQGMMFGFAVKETPELMPLPITLAHALARELAAGGGARRTIPYLRPGRKDPRSRSSTRAVCRSACTPSWSPRSTIPGCRTIASRPTSGRFVVKAAIPEAWLDKDTIYIVNGTGRFTIGGPMGGRRPHGPQDHRRHVRWLRAARRRSVQRQGSDEGGSLRGVRGALRREERGRGGLAERLQIQIAYVIGGARPISLNVESFGTGQVSDERIKDLIAQHFDFRPGAIIERFKLRRPIYRQTASYGHFGRPDLELPWERLELAPLLARGAGEKAALA